MIVCRGVRGATTVVCDDRESVLRATRELLGLMIRLNDIQTEDVASAIFTTTPDVISVFPATAARQLGWLDVPLKVTATCVHWPAVRAVVSMPSSPAPPLMAKRSVPLPLDGER